MLGIPSVGDAKRIAKDSRLRRCVILFETADGRVGYSSYGDTKALCGGTKEIMDEIFSDVEHRIQFDSAMRAPTTPAKGVGANKTPF